GDALPAVGVVVTVGDELHVLAFTAFHQVVAVHPAHRRRFGRLRSGVLLRRDSGHTAGQRDPPVVNPRPQPRPLARPFRGGELVHQAPRGGVFTELLQLPGGDVVVGGRRDNLRHRFVQLRCRRGRVATAGRDQLLLGVPEPR